MKKHLSIWCTIISKRLPSRDFSTKPFKHQRISLFTCLPKQLNTHVAWSISLNAGLFLSGLYLMAPKKLRLFSISTKDACIPQREILIHWSVVITAQSAARVHFCPSFSFLTTSNSWFPWHYFSHAFISINHIAPKIMITMSSAYAVSPLTILMVYRYRKRSGI